MERANSREFSDFDAQCNKIKRLKAAEMAKYPLIDRYWSTLTDDECTMIETIALERIRQGHAHPRIAYFWMWMEEERKDGTLNFSEFARLINVQRHVVSRQILPNAMRCLVWNIDQVLLAYLKVTRLAD